MRLSLQQVADHLRLSLFIVGGLLWATSQTALANEPWVIPEACGTQRQFEEAIRTRVGNDADALLAQTVLAIRTDTDGYSLTVRVGEQLRTLTDRNCRDLFHAGVVVAIAFWNAPEKARSSTGVTPSAPAQATSDVPNETLLASELPPAQQVQRTDSTPKPLPRSPVPLVQSLPSRERPQTARFYVGAQLGLMNGLLPELSTTFGPVVAYDSTHFGLAATARFLPANEKRDPLDKGVRVYAMGYTLSFYYKPDRAIGVEAGVFAYRLTGNGLGSKVTTTSNIVAWGPQLGVWFMPLEYGAWYTRLGAEAQFVITPPRFVISGYDEVFRPSPVLFQGHLGAGVRF
jgi:hypothetical protein